MNKYRALPVLLVCFALASVLGCADSVTQSDPATTPIKEKVRNLYGVIQAGNVNDLAMFVASDVVDHNLLPTIKTTGLDAAMEKMTIFRTAFPDLKITVEDIVAEGDKATARITTTGTHRGEFLGVAATNKKFEISGVETIRFSEGKVVEVWGQADLLTMMTHLGLAPSQFPVNFGERKATTESKPATLNKAVGTDLAANLATVQSVYHVVNSGSIDDLPSYIDQDIVNHKMIAGMEVTGEEACEAEIAMLREAFPDIQITVEDIFADGDKVSVRARMTGTHRGEFQGIAATNKRVDVTSIDIARFSDGKVVEVWGQSDKIGLLTQLGIAP